MADTDKKDTTQLDALDKTTKAEDKSIPVEKETPKAKARGSKPKVKTSTDDKEARSNKSEIAAMIDPFQSVVRVWPD